MKRWVSNLPIPPVQKWQSRTEILREHNEQLERNRLLGLKSILEGIKREFYTRKHDPDQPRVPAGNPEGGQWTSDSGGSGTSDTAEQRTRTAARISPGREAECEAQYKLDSAICRIVKTRVCWQQAARRRAACISGYQLPPLNF